MKNLKGQPAMQSLIKYLKKFTELSDEFADQLEKHCRIRFVRKKKFIHSPLDFKDSVYFLSDGVARGLVKHKGKDITTWFSFGNDIVGVIKDPSKEIQDTEEYIQALEDSEIVMIPLTLIEYLYLNFSEIHVIARQLLEIKNYQASERAILARIPTASDRYERLENSKTIDFNRVALKDVASFLGMRLETLSRMRSKLS